MVPYDNVIVTDIDGCVLYYEHSFHMWMIGKGFRKVNSNHYSIAKRYNISETDAENFVRSFNESAMLYRLPPIKDAIKYIRKLHEGHGFVFHAITAVPNEIHVHEARSKNLDNLFGGTVFERIILCDHSAEKPKYLKEYEGTECYWVEDLPQNAEMGLEFGLQPLLMDRSYNKRFSHPSIKRVNNWKEIYEIVTGQ
jgi:hypothetical protein